MDTNGFGAILSDIKRQDLIQRVEAWEIYYNRIRSMQIIHSIEEVPGGRSKSGILLDVGHRLTQCSYWLGRLKRDADLGLVYEGIFRECTEDPPLLPEL